MSANQKPRSRTHWTQTHDATPKFDGSEGPLQAYIRHLHETTALQNDNDEPVRGRDPWLGVGS